MVRGWRWAVRVSLGVLIVAAVYTAVLAAFHKAPRGVPATFGALVVVTVAVLVVGLALAFIMRLPGIGLTMPWLRFRDAVRKALEP